LRIIYYACPTINTAATQRTKSLASIFLHPIVLNISLDALQIADSCQYDPWAVPFRYTRVSIHSSFQGSL